MANITIHGEIPQIEPYIQGENYFLHDALCSKEPVCYKKVIAGAKKSIRILDPYALENDATRVFECIQEDSLIIDIITTGYEEDEIKAAADDIVDIIKKNVSSCSLNIISYKERNVEKKQRIPLWHDRYLIVDDTDCYLVGSSLDAQQTTDKHHGMLLLTEDDDKKIVTDLLRKYIKMYNSIRAYKTSRK